MSAPAAAAGPSPAPGRERARATGWPCVDTAPGRGRARRQVATGEAILVQGRPSPGVWLIEHGVVETSCRRGHKTVVLGTAGPGDIVGDLPLLTGTRSPVSTRALTPTSAFFMDATSFQQLLAGRSALARCWLRLVARRQLAAQARAVDAARGGSAATRVARALLQEAAGGTVRCTQADLAALTGMRRPTVNRVLHQFEQAGLVQRGYGSITVLSQAGLSTVGDVTTPTPQQRRPR